MTSEKEYLSAIEELQARANETRKRLAELRKLNSAEERKQRDEAEQMVGRWAIEALAGDWKAMDFEEFRRQIEKMACEFSVECGDEGRDAAYARLARAKKRKQGKSKDEVVADADAF